MWIELGFSTVRRRWKWHMVALQNSWWAPRIRLQNCMTDQVSLFDPSKKKKKVAEKILRWCWFNDREYFLVCSHCFWMVIFDEFFGLTVNNVLLEIFFDSHVWVELSNFVHGMVYSIFILLNFESKLRCVSKKIWIKNSINIKRMRYVLSKPRISRV